jgi:hypothetical protein
VEKKAKAGRSVVSWDEYRMGETQRWSDVEVRSRDKQGVGNEEWCCRWVCGL